MRILLKVVQSNISNNDQSLFKELFVYYSFENFYTFAFIDFMLTYEIK
jgi:hypothetical protein